MHQGRLNGAACRPVALPPKETAALRRPLAGAIAVLLSLMAAGVSPASAAESVGVAPANPPPGSSAPSASPEVLVASDDGTLIIDRRSRLAWTRCVEGMAWNGQTCTGQPRRMTYGEALALATARYKSEGVGWRIPRLTELRRFAGWDAASRYFPGDPRDWTWTSTLRIDSVQSNAGPSGRAAGLGRPPRDRRDARRCGPQDAARGASGAPRALTTCARARDAGLRPPEPRWG